MKIKPEHFEKLKQAVEAAVAAKPGVADEYRKAGLSQMRFRWDALLAARIDGQPGTRFICDVLYEYLNDEHIDTALRAIFGHSLGGTWKEAGELNDAQKSMLVNIGNPDPLNAPSRG
jgi:hypothetical protein